MSKLPVLCLMGPTAVGKTDLAIHLYEKLATDLPLELISVDSTMVYKGLDIGTGKPSAELLARIPHKLVDIREPHQIYSVADFCADTKHHIDMAHQSHKIPLLVGGTMMYFKALQNGLAKLPSSRPEIREDLMNKLKNSGLASLYQELLNIDPQRAVNIDANDTQRIIRALEIYYISGQTMSELLAHDSVVNPVSDHISYDFVNIIISSDDRSFIHKNIEGRFHAMLASGFVEEVESLFNNPLLHTDLPALRACGYKQIWQYLAGDMSKDQMIEQSIITTRQLAKRQLTWLRSFMQDATVSTSWYEVRDRGYQEKIINSLLAFDLIKRIV